MQTDRETADHLLTTEADLFGSPYIRRDASTSSPSECRKQADWDSNGPDWHARDAIHQNLDHVVNVAKAADQVFVCFGAIAWDGDWINHVVEAVQTGVEPWPDLWCWGETASGAPKHPLARGKHRIPADQPALLWSPSIAPRALAA